MSILSPQANLSQNQQAKLARFQTTREACLIVFVLAGASDTSGRTIHEILQDAARLTDGGYEGEEGLRKLRFARLYLSQTGHLKCAPRMSPMSGRSASAFTRVPFRLFPAWRRSELAEEQTGKAAKAALEERFPSGPKRQSGGLRGLLPGRRFIRRLTSLLG